MIKQCMVIGISAMALIATNAYAGPKMSAATAKATDVAAVTGVSEESGASNQAAAAPLPICQATCGAPRAFPGSTSNGIEIIVQTPRASSVFSRATTRGGSAFTHPLFHLNGCINKATHLLGPQTAGLADSGALREVCSGINMRGVGNPLPFQWGNNASNAAQYTYCVGMGC